MNIVRELLREHSKTMCNRIVRYVGQDKKRFKDLVDAFLKGPYRVTQRASWPLSYCVEYHPGLIRPHLKRIIVNLETPGIHVAVKRNTVRLLQFVRVPPSLQGTVTTLCFQFLSDARQPIAVRVFSMTVLAHIAREQPGLKKELKLLLEDQLPYGSTGFINRAQKVLKELN